MSDDRDAVFEEWGDLLHEVPEAEEALQRYRAKRAQQSEEVARFMASQKEHLARAAAWEDLREELGATYLSDTIH
ncbi:hypothetical protein [Nitratireductor pacificus]|uniref:Uncharacterized protein n=1 Tax=Nitratireductor pacificus pht-3B TaxID=391937 RepID=K2LI88_9HYPH|nr:hypothetical protein [Nitratireductor pacificus]EKF17469.1 hypothetical protein NA2_18191 [Nitratireductor pacificus pht-3B]